VKNEPGQVGRPVGRPARGPLARVKGRGAIRDPRRVFINPTSISAAMRAASRLPSPPSLAFRFPSVTLLRARDCFSRAGHFVSVTLETRTDSVLREGPCPRGAQPSEGILHSTKSSEEARRRITGLIPGANLNSIAIFLDTLPPPRGERSNFA